MGTVRPFVATDTSSIWQLLNEIGDAVNPVTQDTGFRDIAALFNGDAMWGGSAQIRRVGAMVSVQGYATVAAGSTFIGKTRAGTTFLAIPVGFRPVYRNYPIGVGSSNLGGVGWVVGSSRLSVPDAAGTWAQGNSIGFTATWMTNEPWPADLPGTAV